MDGFTYYDIFQTKGMEYIIIIAFLLLLIPFWLIINKRPEIIRKIKEIGVLTMDALRIPKGVFFGRNHTWAYLEKSGLAEVGVDDMLLHLTGEVTFRKNKKEGDEIKKGELLTEIVKDGKVLRVVSPVSGRIMETNPDVDDMVEKGDDPYTKGWIYRIEPTNWAQEMSTCIQGEEARGWFRQELDRFKDFIAVVSAKNSPGTAGVVLQEGGELRDNTLSELPGEVWQDFQKEFLDTR